MRKSIANARLIKMHVMLRRALKLFVTESTLMRFISCNRFHQDILYKQMDRHRGMWFCRFKVQPLLA